MAGIGNYRGFPAPLENMNSLRRHAQSPMNIPLQLENCRPRPCPVAAAPSPSERTTPFHCSHEKIALVISRIKLPCLALASLLCLSLPTPARALFGNKNKAAEQAGALLFRAKDCVHCHGEGGIGANKGPSLIDLRKKKEWTPVKITGQIMNGGKKMPPFSDALTDSEIAQLVAYLRARHRPLPPPATASPATR